MSLASTSDTDQPQNAGFTGATESFDTSSLESEFSSLNSEYAQTAGDAFSTAASNASTSSSSVTATSISGGAHRSNPTTLATSISDSAPATTKQGASANTPSTSSDDTSSGLPPGAKAGIGVGIAILITCIIAGFLIFKYRRSKRTHIAKHDRARPGKKDHVHDEDPCVYHAKPELEDTSTPRNSTGNLLCGELSTDSNHDRDSIAELEGSRPKPVAPSGAVELGPD